MSTVITSGDKLMELATLLIPVENKNLVLPNVSVAEIIDYRKIIKDEGLPDWHIGTLDWRTKSLPMVSFEVVNGEPHAGDDEMRAKIVIVNGVTSNEELPFWGFVSAGSPRLMRLMDDEDIKQSDEVCGPAEQMAITISGEQAHIPDLDYIEGMIMGQR